jgi:hypothetical protein
MNRHSTAGFCLLISIGSLSVIAGKSLVLEAERFEDPGGWVVDSQFIDQMGSSYLLAHGLGKPVGNARTKVQVPVAGQYQVWVRTKNWVPGPWEAPGRFKLIINGTEQDTVYGTQAGWQWQKGDAVDLKPGQTTVELKDLTGFDARCDALFLTTDKDLVPDNSSEPLNKWRLEQFGTKVLPAEKIYDLVVVGGGLAGMGAALSGARMGLTVALIENRPVLGGNGSSQIRVAPRGNTPGWLYPFGDMVREFSPYSPSNAAASDQYFDAAREQVIRTEKRIDLFLDHHAFAVETGDNRITSVSAITVKENAIRQFRGSYFVDATGHGILGLKAGADYHMEEKDRMGMSNLWNWRFTADKQPFPDVPWALPLTEKGFPYPDKKGDWFWESGFDRHPLNDLEAIRDHNFRAIFGAWNAIKNKNAYAAKDPSGNSHATAQLEWVAYIGGTRETLQLLGDVVLSKADIIANRQFPDACVISTWGMDLHYPHPLYQPESQDNPFISRAHFGGHVEDAEGPLSKQETHYVTSKDGHGFDRKKGYAVPYRCLYSRNIENLFMPGRNMSVTHEVLGTVRVMQTLGMAGVAVGRAAWVAKKHDTTPRGVYEQHLDELKTVWALPANYRSPEGLAADKDMSLDLGGRVQPVPLDSKFSQPGYFVWCGAPIRGADGKYHLYYSRWPVTKGFHPGWAIYSEIAYAVADKPFGPYRFVNVVLPPRGINAATGRKFWDADMTHNPNIIQHQGKLLLYYIGNYGDGQYATHRNNDRIGVAIADKPEGPWRRFDEPIIDVSRDAAAFDSLCVSNPAAAVRLDGGLIVIYKAVPIIPGKLMGGNVRHGVATADRPEGPYLKKPGRVFEVENADTKNVWMLAEDPFIWFSRRYGDRYYAIARDVIGKFTGASGGLALFESRDGFHWQAAAHPKVLDTCFTWADGTKSGNRVERPALLFDGENPVALFGGTDGYEKNGCIAFNVHIPLKSPAGK